MNPDVARELAALVGLELDAATRAGDALVLRFAGERGAAVALEVAAPWRLVDGERVLVGSGDLLTPADPDGEPETFDWEPDGASWLDVRLRELAERRGAARPAVTAAQADAFGGARLTFADGLTLEVFPTSTPTGHVSTEFWRLTQRDGASFVVGTFGVEREPAA